MHVDGPRGTEPAQNKQEKVAKPIKDARHVQEVEDLQGERGRAEQPTEQSRWRSYWYGCSGKHVQRT